MVNFVLTGLNTEINLYNKVDYPERPTYSEVTAAYTITLNVSEDKLRNIFFFKTTNPELTTDETDNDCEFYCDSVNWPDISFSEGIIGNFLKNDTHLYRYNTLKLFGPCLLANNITGGYNNSDIFKNESELVSQYVTLDTDVSYVGIKQQIQSKLNLGGTTEAPLTNINRTHSNISREILNFFLGSSNPDIVQRVHQKIQDASDNDWINLCFEPGDIITFYLKYDISLITNENSIAIDASGKSLGTNLVEYQDFKVILNVTSSEPETLTEPFAVAGYYPLYYSEAAANAASPSSSSHSLTLYGTTYYMPNGVTMYHGTYGAYSVPASQPEQQPEPEPEPEPETPDGFTFTGYGSAGPLEYATVEALDIRSGNVLSSTTTDEYGYYSLFVEKNNLTSKSYSSKNSTKKW